MTAFIAALDSALLHFVWQGVVVAVVLWVVLASLRRRSANLRYLAGCAAMLLLALLPVATAWRSYQRPVADRETAVTIVEFVTAADAASKGIDWLALARSWMAPAWACGVFLLSLRMLWGYAKVSRLRRDGEAAERAVTQMVENLVRRMKVNAPVRVLMSRLADGPSVVGWIKPVLLLPASTVLGLSAEQLEAVVAHELAHIRRYDYLANLGQMLMETLFFYHPAVWWISRRMREERELCCDDIAVRVCGDAVCYARALTALEKIRVLNTSLALGAKDGPLMYRIERLLGLARREPAPARLPGMVAICLVLACLAPSSNPARAQQATLAEAPLPAAPALSKPTPRMIAQVVRPASLPVATSSPTGTEELTVEVTVDSNGDVSDARVLSGPMERRRSALFSALNMHFPQDDAPGTRLVNIPASGAIATQVRRAEPVLTRAAASEQANSANARIAALRAQQAQASEAGAAQLQEAIDVQSGIVSKMQKFIYGPDPLVGAVLGEIRIDGVGVTEQERARLRALLPFHLHDRLTDELPVVAVRAVWSAYPNASAYYGLLPNGEAAFIVTLPPVR